MNRDFTLIDLDSQAVCFWSYVRGWGWNRILEWLALHGTLIHISHPMDDQLYLFLSIVGIQTGFRVGENGEFVILYEHTTRVVKEPEI